MLAGCGDKLHPKRGNVVECRESCSGGTGDYCDGLHRLCISARSVWAELGPYNLQRREKQVALGVDPASPDQGASPLHVCHNSRVGTPPGLPCLRLVPFDSKLNSYRWGSGAKKKFRRSARSWAIGRLDLRVKAERPGRYFEAIPTAQGDTGTVRGNPPYCLMEVCAWRVVREGIAEGGRRVDA